MSNKSSGGSGIGVLGLLGVVFVTLRLIGVINWSWWYVTLPFYGGFALALAIILIGCIVTLVKDIT
jgi:hypothetical protein